MSRYPWIMIVALGIWVMDVNSLAHALIIESPVEGQNVVVGEPYNVWVRLAQGEVCDSVGPGLSFNSKTGRYEGTDRITPDDIKGEREEGYLIIVLGEGKKCRDARVNITVVLSSTTTVQSIDALIGNDKETFLDIARKPNRELVGGIRRGEDVISVGGLYSDGIERLITTHPDAQYSSADEKVAIVLSPGNGGNSYKDRALVRATGPGKTEIIVRYKGHESRVTVHVQECPYIEGVTDKEGCPF